MDILNKTKLNRTELSRVYKISKDKKLNIKWLDLFRLSTRGESIQLIKDKYYSKYIVSGTIIKKITIVDFKTEKTHDIIKKEKYNKIYTTENKKEALTQAKKHIKSMSGGDKEYDGSYIEIKYKPDKIKATPYDKFTDQSELKTKMKNCINPKYNFFNEDQKFLKNTGYCVLDNIIGKYEGRTRIKKKINREWLIERCCEISSNWEIEEGITPEMIEYIFKSLDISVYAFDVNNKCFSKYICKHRDHPALVYYCINDHMYMISDNDQIKKLVSSSISDDKKINSCVFQNKKNNNDNIYDLDIYDNVDINDLEKYSNCLIIYSKHNLNDEVINIIKQYNIIPSDIKTNGVNFLQCKVKDIYLQIDPNEDEKYNFKDIIKICKAMDIKFKNQTFVSVIKEFRKKFFTGDKKEEEEKFIKEDISKSSFNNQTKNIINSLYSKNHAFIETIYEPDNRYKYKLYKLDINKCRRNCLYYSKYNFPVFNVMDEVEEYKGIKKEGLYFVETTNYIPLRGSGWYSQPVIEYCINEELIKENDIKYVIYSSSTLKKDYFNDFIDTIINKLSDYDTNDVKFSKLAINSIIGTFKPNEERINYKSMCITTNPNNAFHHFINYDNSVIDNIDIDDKTYYHIFKTSKTDNEESESPLYNMILDMEAVLVHKLKKQIEKNNGVVVDIMTDCITCYFNSKFPFKIDKDNNIDCMYYEKNKPVVKIEASYECDDISNRNIISRMPKEKGMRFGCYIPEKPIWNIIEDVENNDFSTLVDDIIDNNKSCNIDGRAGCGKSYLIKELQKKMKEKNLKYISLAPTNKASNIINGSTIHKYVIQHTKKHLQDTQIDYIFIDEISMVSSYFYKFFNSLKKLKPNCKFIIVGDFNQLPPVQDKKEYQYKNSYILWELSEGNRIKLNKCRRSDDTLYNMLSDDNIMKLDKKDFNNNYNNNINICFTNLKRKQINEICMNRESRGKKYIKLDEIDDEKSQDVKLFIGCPVIAKKNCKNKGFVNNDQFIINYIDKEFIELIENDKMITISINDFQKNFCVGYCITTHSSQGATIKEPYTIYEYEYMSKPMRYVALSRSTTKHNINIF